MNTAILYILISVIGSAGGQLLLKKGMNSMGPVTLSVNGLGAVLWRMATNLNVFLGLTIFFLGTVFWLAALSRVELSYAYPFASLTYVVTLGASWLIFGESITLGRVIGTIVIGLGDLVDISELDDPANTRNVAGHAQGRTLWFLEAAIEMRILSVVGARPEFVQAMPVSWALRADHQEILVHTGQHYDYRMSQTFFDELDIPAPDYNLGVGSGSQAHQTAEVMVGLEGVLLEVKPDLVIVRGDTNSSVAASLAASKLSIPLAHIEAGERSFNRKMPEEINRLVADRLADMHFCVSEAAQRHLASEGITDSVHLVGDVMLDALLYAQPLARSKSKILQQLRIEPRRYSLVTIHRPANTDDPERLSRIFSALNQIAEALIIPLHPRTAKALASSNIHLEKHIQLIDPVGYFDMLSLEENARLIATDSGGVQREAYYMSVPCLTLRDETEWTATVETGWNKLVGANQELIVNDWFSFSPPAAHPPIYGTGTAAKAIAAVLNSPVVENMENNRF